MKSIPILLCFAGFAHAAQAQVSAGATGFTVKSGTVFSFEGLSFTPSADLSIQNQTISMSATPAVAGTGSTIARVYSVSPSLIFSGAAGIKYAAGELNGNQENTLKLVTGSGNFTAFNNSAPGGAGTYSVSVSGLNNVPLSRLSATSAAVPLSIRYDDFRVGSGSGCTSLLSWNASRAGTANFIIERSGDAQHFEALALTLVQNDQHFTATDPLPLKDRNYYRLSIRETGAMPAYSSVVSIQHNCRQAQTLVYPNPAGNAIFISLAAAPDKVVCIDLLDISGKVLRSLRTSLQTSKLDLQTVAAGTYWLQIQNGSAREHIQVVKQ